MSCLPGSEPGYQVIDRAYHRAAGGREQVPGGESNGNRENTRVRYRLGGVV